MSKTITMSQLSPLISELLGNKGEVIITITGNSMSPMLQHGRDKVYLSKPSEGRLKKYDIPLYCRENGQYVLHRIIAVKPEGYAIRGDNQCITEYPVKHSQVHAVVTGFIRNGRYITCVGLRYRIYCRLWNALLPIRWIYYRMLRLLKRLLL